MIGLARRRPLLDEVAAELARWPSAHEVRVCDVSDSVAYRQALGQIEDQRGRIDILINNAGVDLMIRASGGEEGILRRVFDVNFFATAVGTMAVLPGMVSRRSGIVVNVSSDAARAPEPGQAAYASSKAAISAFTEAAAHEVFRHGVSLHVLYPGWVPTAMGLSGNEDGGSLPPKLVRRTADGVANLVAERMGGARIDINAALLPLLVPLARILGPVFYQRAMRRMATTGEVMDEQ